MTPSTAALPLNAPELQAGLNDPDAWNQEYLCDFMDNSTVLLPYDLIESCEATLATESTFPASLAASAYHPRVPFLYAGIDFARKNHLTVCWILERIPNPSASMKNAQWSLLTREVLCLKNLSTPEQLEILRPRLRRCQRICLDYTDPGVGLGDYLARELNPPGGVRFRHELARRYATHLELCQFTAPF